MTTETQTAIQKTAIIVSLYENKHDVVPRKMKTTVANLLGAEHEVRTEKDGQLFSAAIFASGSRRAKQNVQFVTAICLDFDKKTRDDAVEIFKKLKGTAYAAVSTFSHEKKDGKIAFRVLFPIDKPMPPQKYEKVILQVMEDFEGMADPACKDCSRMFYTPSVHPDLASDSFIRYGMGSLYDVEDARRRFDEKPKTVSPKVVATPSNNSLCERAVKYLEKMGPAVSGNGGHSHTFHAACVLVKGFGLNAEDARPILQAWNESCSPPWTEKELEHKLTDALRAPGPIGEIAYDRTQNYRPPKTPMSFEKTPDSPSREVHDEIDEIIGGERYCVKFPWSCMNSSTQALLPGYVSALCGTPGASKSFLVLQMFTDWLQTQPPIKASVLMLEDARSFHLRRVWAQLAGNAFLTDDDWINKHQDEVAESYSTHKATLDRIGKHIHVPGDMNGIISSKWVIAWIEKQFKDGDRVLIVDPISLIDWREIWIEDKRFLLKTKKLAEKYKGSVILVVHPKKGAGDAPHLDSLGGSASIPRFSHTTFWLEYHSMKSDKIKCSAGIFQSTFNRTMHVLKGRSGPGSGNKIALLFKSESLLTEEVGFID